MQNNNNIVDDILSMIEKNRETTEIKQYVNELELNNSQLNILNTTIHLAMQRKQKEGVL